MEPASSTDMPPSADADAFGLRDTSGPVPGLAGLAYVRSDDATRCGGIAVAIGRDRTIAVPTRETELAAFLAVEFPRGLDFTAAREQSMNTFARWLEDTKDQARAAASRYEPQKASPNPAEQAAAWARLAQIQRHFASLLLRAEIPVDIRTGDNASEKIDAYCDALAEAAQPLLAIAQTSATQCRDVAAPAGWWSSVCAP